MNQMTKISEEEAHEIYRQSLIIDGLAGYTFAFDALKEAGVTAAHITLAAHNEGFLEAIEAIKDCYAALQAHPNLLLLVRSVSDIRRAKKEGKVALIFGFQTSSPVEDDLTNLWVFEELGIRIIQLTYMTRNLVGYGCYEEDDRGLTYYGKTFIREMDRLGLLIDLSHVGWKTAEEAIRVSQNPVIISHSNPYSMCANRRNVPDELLKMISDKGGVVGINAYPPMCVLDPNRQPTMEDYLDIMEYTIDLVGIDSVGIAPDLFEGMSDWQKVRWNRRYDELSTPWSAIKGFAHETDITSLAPKLARRGYGEMEIRKILGLNFMRVFETVWPKGAVYI